MTWAALLPLALLGFSTTPPATAVSFVDRFGGINVDLYTSVACSGDACVAVGTFDGTGSSQLTPSASLTRGTVDGVVVSYNTTTGAVAWLRSIGGSGVDTVTSVAMDGVRSSYVLGHTTAVFSTMTSRGQQDVFVAKYDAFGTRLWIQSLSSAALDQSASICIDPSNSDLYITGYVSSGGGSVFYGGVDTGAVAGTSNKVFLTKVDKDGNHGWTKVFGGTGNDMGTAVACGAGNVFVGGIAGVGMNLGSLSFTQAGSDDGFTAKIASDGTEQWLTRIGASGADQLLGLALDRSGNVFAGGWFTGSMTIGSRTTNSGVQSGYIARLNGGTGAAVWAQWVTGSGGASVRAVVQHPTQSTIYAAGMAGAAWGAGLFSFDDLGGGDALVVELDWGSGSVTSAVGVGGTGVDAGRALAFASDGNLVLVGLTRSTNIAWREVVVASSGFGSNDGFIVSKALPLVPPATNAPTTSPTPSPTANPTTTPSVRPTLSPTAMPTLAPTTAPSVRPTLSPTPKPTLAPSTAPTAAPTLSPSTAPTFMPTLSPTASPTTSPSAAPTRAPTVGPTSAPTIQVVTAAAGGGAGGAGSTGSKTVVITVPVVVAPLLVGAAVWLFVVLRRRRATPPPAAVINASWMGI